MEPFKIAIIIPAFNEEDTIFKVIESVKDYGIVIVVNDDSNDKTMKIATEAGAIVVTHEENQGYDGALNSGFLKAKELDCDGVITFDADGQHSSSLLIKYIEYLKNGFDLVLGVRPNFARVSELLFSFYTRLKFGWKDPLCGMKGYSMRLYKNQGYFDSFNSIGTELAFFALSHKYKYIQLPVPIIKRHDKSRFSSSFLGNMKILKALTLIIKKN
jgi:glycosyltransferase involved in cell wall biosynthesis